MKTRKLVRKVLISIMGLLAVGLLVFVTAGIMPYKDGVHGTRRSVYVTMADGTRIAVRYTLPEALQKGERIPAVMESTRYGTAYKSSFLLNALLNLGIAKEIPPAIINTLMDSKYAFVAVDTRGSGASFGSRDMELSREEIGDLGQVIEWIAKQPWSNGKVATYGISYSGNTAELAAVSNHPALFAAAPLYPDFDPIRQNGFPGGIRNEYLLKEWGAANLAMDANKIKDIFNRGTAPVDSDKGGRILKDAVASHKTIDIYESVKNINCFDEVIAGDYTSNSLAAYSYKREIEKSEVPMYIRVGWQDSATVNGALERFLTFKNKQTLVIGPWSHAGWHFYDPFLAKKYNKQQLDKAQAEEVVGFFKSCLEGKNENIIRYYTFGEGKWKTTESWPVAGFENKTLYFGPGGSLVSGKPAENAGEDLYKVDFTASTGNSNRWFTNLGGGAIYYPDRAQEDKKLMTYTSEPMAEDTEITGTPVVTLDFTSDAEDGAFFVYLEDVAPDGRVTYITEGELRALHRKTTNEDLGYTVLGPRHSFRKKDIQPLIPGQPTEMKIGMNATSVLIQKGHKIRVAIAGNDAANFAKVPAKGTPTIQVLRNSSFASRVELPMKTVLLR